MAATQIIISSHSLTVKGGFLQHWAPAANAVNRFHKDLTPLHVSLKDGADRRAVTDSLDEPMSCSRFP